MPHTSPYPPLTLPEVDLFTFFFARKDRDYPEHKVLFQDASEASRKYTYLELQKSAKAFGQALIGQFQIKKGDVIGIVSQNDVDTPVSILAAQWAGAIVTPANPQYTADELAYQLKDSGASLVVAHVDSLAVVRAACKKTGIDQTRIILQGPRIDTTSKFPHWRDIIPSQEHQNTKRPSFNPKQDIAYLVYSSGTTGKAKGVGLSHYNVTSNILQGIAGESDMVSWCGDKGDATFPAAIEGDKLIACLPFYHIYGLTLLIQIPLYQGLLCLVMAKFDIEKWCQAVQTHRITLGFIVPPIVVQLVKHPRVPNYDLTSLRICTSGAAPLSPTLIEACHQRTSIRIKQGYGLSETSPIICTQKWHDWRRKCGSIGPLMPGIEAKFCKLSTSEEDSANQTHSIEEVGLHETGELYVRGPNVFQWYHNKPLATAECLSPDGWFRTGDVGHIDHEGDMYITDRLKELIKYNGFQVAPAELEGYLLENPLVEDVVVVGVYSEIFNTEIPRAYVVRSNGGLKAVERDDDRKIVEWLNERVAAHKKLRGGVEFVREIPKSAAGKILRRLVRERANSKLRRIDNDKPGKSLKGKL